MVPADKLVSAIMAFYATTERGFYQNELMELARKEVAEERFPLVGRLGAIVGKLEGEEGGVLGNHTPHLKGDTTMTEQHVSERTMRRVRSELDKMSEQVRQAGTLHNELIERWVQSDGTDRETGCRLTMLWVETRQVVRQVVSQCRLYGIDPQ